MTSCNNKVILAPKSGTPGPNFFTVTASFRNWVEPNGTDAVDDANRVRGNTH